MLVAHENKFVRRDINCVIPVNEQKFFGFETFGKLEIADARGELAKFLVVIAKDQLQAAESAQSRKQFREFFRNLGDWDGLMHDVSQDGELLRFIEAAK